MTEDDKQSAAAELKLLNERLAGKAEELKASLAKFAASDSWPVSPRAQEGEGAEAKYQELVGYVTELKDTATEMNTVFNTIREDKSGETTMDIDEGSRPSRSLKRRRLSDPTASAPQVSAEEVDQVLERMATIEERLASVQNDLVGHDDDTKQELFSQLEGRFEDLSLELPPPQGTTSPPVDEVLAVNEKVDVMGKEIGELATEVASLIYRSNQVDNDVQVLRNENAQYKEYFSSVRIA